MSSGAVLNDISSYSIRRGDFHTSVEIGALCPIKS